MAAPRLLEIGTEVVAPFADTVRFIDHEQRDAGVFQRFDGFSVCRRSGRWRTCRSPRDSDKTIFAVDGTSETLGLRRKPLVRYASSGRGSAARRREVAKRWLSGESHTCAKPGKRILETARKNFESTWLRPGQEEAIRALLEALMGAANRGSAPD